MKATTGRRQTAIRRFSGFPAGSLPRLRFDWEVAFKLLINNEFSVRVSREKNFTLSYPERQGRLGGGATLPIGLSYNKFIAKRASRSR